MSMSTHDRKHKIITAAALLFVIISLPPKTFSDVAAPRSHEERIDNVLYWTAGDQNLYPFYWLDPLEDDALEQVDLAVQAGMMGFKVICNRFYPGEDRPMEVFAKVARVGKPILFHTGILWDGRFSSRFNHPENFEALLEVPNLRFCVAHIAWPWCDELIAVYGKFLNAPVYRPDLTCEMFVDISPGTPPVYRREVLTKLFTVGYDVGDNLIFGSDSKVGDYKVQWVRQWLERDRQIFDELGLDPDLREAIYGRNLRRFLDLSQESVSRKHLKIGE